MFKVRIKNDNFDETNLELNVDVWDIYDTLEYGKEEVLPAWQFNKIKEFPDGLKISSSSFFGILSVMVYLKNIKPIAVKSEEIVTFSTSPESIAVSNSEYVIFKLLFSNIAVINNINNVPIISHIAKPFIPFFQKNSSLHESIILPF